MTADTGLIHLARTTNRRSIKQRQTGKVVAGRAKLSLEESGIARFTEALLLVNLLGFAHRAAAFIAGTGLRGRIDHSVGPSQWPTCTAFERSTFLLNRNQAFNTERGDLGLRLDAGNVLT